MSRRPRHGRPPNTHRPGRPAGTGPSERADARVDAPSTAIDAPTVPSAMARADGARSIDEPAVSAVPDPEAAHLRPRPVTDRRPAGQNAAPSPAGANDGRPAGGPSDRMDGAGDRAACTTAQLRRFIKSRPWLPMHELRRRFGITGQDDDVTPMRVGEHLLFVGLPPAEGRILAELLGAGDVGYELSVDPTTPVVIGVYPMRPVPRT
jgi:hypothetical protein